MSDLITELQRADLVVGFNNLRFDYEVLHGYTAFDLTPTAHAGHAGGVAERAAATGSRWTPLPRRPSAWKKRPRGCRPSEWFKEGRLAEIAEYCCYDVKITRLVHEYGAQHQQLHYHNKFGKKLTVPVKW